MGFFDPPPRPIKIKILNVQNRSSKAIISYLSTYADKSTKTGWQDIKYMRTSSAYSGEPHIIKCECLGKVYIGLIKSDVRLVFLVTLSDFTVDLVQEKENTTRCNALLAKSLNENHSEEVTPEKNAKPEKNVEANKWEYPEVDIDIPIEILPNLYSISISNLSIKHRRTYKNGIKQSDSILVKCRVNYSLNGRKEGKRYIIFTAYDKSDGVRDIKGDYKKYHFTAAGYEFVETFFDDYDKNPISKISISIKEI